MALAADRTDRGVLARKLFHDIIPMPRLGRLLSNMIRRLDAEFFHALSKLLFSASVAHKINILVKYITSHVYLSISA